MAPERTHHVIATAAMVVSVAACAPHAPTVATQRVSIGGHRFELELAIDGRTRYQGLSDRESIDPQGGMLFVFPEALKLEFVMRRCFVPIDLIFLDTNGYVIRMHRMNVERNPLGPDGELTKYGSADPAHFAIELDGGTLDKLDLKIADRIDLPLETLKKMAGKS